MSDITYRLIEAPPGIPSPEIGSFVSQLDDQNLLLTEDTRGATIEELAWQPRAGTNTIGMLLAHIAIVEVFWICRAAAIEPECQTVLGIGVDDDGMPIPPDGRPPATLMGKDLAFYDHLLARARAFTYGWANKWTAADLDRRFQRTYANGKTYEMNVRWVLYHILEHEAGHYGQINLLRHLHRDAQVVTGVQGLT